MHLRFMHYPVYKLYFSKVLLLLRVGKKIDGYRKHDLQTKWYRAGSRPWRLSEMEELGRSRRGVGSRWACTESHQSGIRSQPHPRRTWASHHPSLGLCFLIYKLKKWASSIKKYRFLGFVLPPESHTMWVRGTGICILISSLGESNALWGPGPIFGNCGQCAYKGSDLQW